MDGSCFARERTERQLVVTTPANLISLKIRVFPLKGWGKEHRLPKVTDAIALAMLVIETKFH
jgi:hypothetical protein